MIPHRPNFRGIGELPPVVAELLRGLGSRGVELAAVGSDRVAWRGELLPGEVAELRQHKLDVLFMLTAPVAGEEGRYVLAERLGVAEELGLPTHPGSPAWLIATGEAIDADRATPDPLPPLPEPPEGADAWGDVPCVPLFRSDPEHPDRRASRTGSGWQHTRARRRG
ncbi:MAG: hypothetical protein EA378_04080 [Phycisphaerales bacterium]|nr:MAG: hypothetical protein EA378_04080 [Phycisphaerales bacterium]